MGRAQHAEIAKDLAEQIASGKPADALSNPRVVEAYLGSKGRSHAA